MRFASTFIILFACAAITLLSHCSHIFAAEQLDRYWIVLSGDQQIPAVNTDAIGFMSLKFQDDASRLVYNVNLDNIHNVTGVYVNYKSNDHNASTVLDLLREMDESNKKFGKVSAVTRGGEITGTISIGGVTKQDLGGSLKGMALSDLRDQMLNGNVYVTVGTDRHPEGEIRGNSFIGIDRVFPDLDEFDWN